MRSVIAAAMAAAFVFLGASPAPAATKAISIVDNAFSPGSTNQTMGTTFTWANNGDVQHTSTQNSPLRRWSSGPLDPAQRFSFVIRWAGTYGYHCAFHSGMTGRIGIPAIVSPTSGTDESTVFTITVATQAAPTGYRYDLQYRRWSTGTWTRLRYDFTSRTAGFNPSSPANYYFRARLERTSNGATSGWSPARSIRVT